MILKAIGLSDDRSGMKKIAFILPYFGKFNNYFNLFLKSCEYNKDVDWIILTDDEGKYDYPENVKVYYMQFDEIKKIIRSKFDFDVKIETPYKLCDYRPAYGYIFEDYLKKYDFWGHCDCDVIFGKIRDFVTDELLNDYDKLFCLGHLSLYKNSDAVNKGFTSELRGHRRYIDVYSSNVSFTFDEDFLPDNINDVFEANDFKIYKDDWSANFSNRHEDFRLVRYDKLSGNFLKENKNDSIFVYVDGRIKRYQKHINRIKETEYLYMHLQNRNMKIETSNYKCIKVVPNVFAELEVEKVTDENFNSIRKKYPNDFRRQFIKREILFWAKRIKRRIKRC